MSPWQQCSSKGLLSSLLNFFRAVNTDKMEILLSKAHNNNLDIWFLNCIKLNSDICQRCLEHKKVLFLANLVMFAIHVVCKAEDCICISDSKEKVQLKDEFGQSRCQQHKSFHHMTLKLTKASNYIFPHKLLEMFLQKDVTIFHVVQGTTNAIQQATIDPSVK